MQKEKDLFNMWYHLWNEYKSLNYNGGGNRLKLEMAFRKVSIRYFNNSTCTRRGKADFFNQLKRTYLLKNLKGYTPCSACKEFLNYLYYVSDRMTIDRWLYLRFLLNKGIM
jgi:hypothetical protein